MHAAAHDQFAQRVFEFGAQQVRALRRSRRRRRRRGRPGRSATRCAREPRPASSAGAGARPVHSAALRRGSSRIGVARSDGCRRPRAASPAAGRSRVHSVRPAVHRSSSQARRVVVDARRQQLGLPQCGRRLVAFELRQHAGQRFGAADPAAAPTCCHSNRKRTKSRGSTGSISRRSRLRV